MKYKLRKDPINEIPKGQLIFWIIVRVTMIICATYSFVTGDVVMGFESIFCFIFFTSLGYVPDFRSHKFYY